MRTLRELMATHARPGRLDWIGLRPARRQGVVSVPDAEVTDAGLQGDHGRAGKRAVTLIQAEHLPAIAALCDGVVTPEVLRRNLVVSGINLAALRGQVVQLGAATLRLIVPCAPCSRMEEALGTGGYSAVRHHGGWCAEVVTPGHIALGAALTPGAA
ncbi:MOSC domain-containing protein [Jannaschia sp. M317]|uniref:MOSC domain-containing protein n=1 Tax=Jannaschia sp. M317 TaxID=2867011 RepID=UPI0021A2E916|nr:MOSC domain-containing protein [Jannaschia sp. M317]UWQ17716.1 MOSC domain-containing protein [Jannaschia sp. M317]